MLESKKFPREFITPINNTPCIKKAPEQERQCNQLSVRIQNESMNISDISEKMYTISQELKRKSKNSSFEALLASLGFTAISLVRLIAATLAGGFGKRRRGLVRRQNVDQVLREARRLASSVDKLVFSTRNFVKGNEEMEAMVRNLGFHNEYLKKRQAKLNTLVEQQKRFRCLD